MTQATLAAATPPVPAPAEMILPGAELIDRAALRSAILADLAEAPDARTARAIAGAPSDRGEGQGKRRPCHRLCRPPA